MAKKRDRHRKAAANLKRDQERSRQVLFETMIKSEAPVQPCHCCPPTDPRGVGLGLFIDGPLSPMTISSESGYSSVTTPGDVERDQFIPDWLLPPTPTSMVASPVPTPDLIKSAAAWLKATPLTDGGQDLFPQWPSSSTLDAAICLLHSAGPYKADFSPFI